MIDRFAQIEPKILIGVDGYQYGGKKFSRIEALKKIRNALPSVEKVVVIPYLDPTVQSWSIPNSVSWIQTRQSQSTKLVFKRVDFDHPIWILYSSGTTGLPKAITHGHGGVLMEHLKYLTLHNDVKPGERFFWFTTTGWMMWNIVQATLLCGSTIVLYDGSPTYPDINVLWQLAEESGLDHFGTSASFITACMKAGIKPGTCHDLTKLRSFGSTGSPLAPEGFDWVYKEIKGDIWLASVSGGTDVCSAFVGGNPMEPVYSGEIQCRALGCKLESYNEAGQPVLGQVGEMVISKPMPSMPVYFWNDKDFTKYSDSYFEKYPGVWRHGDWTQITPEGGVIIYGRSDSTLNRGGIRIGTSEIYRALDKIPEIQDGLIICLDRDQGEFYMPLFLVIGPDHKMDGDMMDRIRKTIRDECSPRHVPDEILEIQEVPYTISGKKVETPIKKILMGQDPVQVINPDALKNPDSIQYFMELSKKGNFGK